MPAQGSATDGRSDSEVVIRVHLLGGRVFVEVESAVLAESITDLPVLLAFIDQHGGGLTDEQFTALGMLAVALGAVEATSHSAISLEYLSATAETCLVRVRPRVARAAFERGSREALALFDGRPVDASVRGVLDAASALVGCEPA